MTKYERYTSKDGATLTMSQWGGSPAELELYRKLAELEDKIENGTLIECNPELLGAGVIGIYAFLDGTYELCLDENIVIGFNQDEIVTWNNTQGAIDHFWSGLCFEDSEMGRIEAEAKLRELKGE